MTCPKLFKKPKVVLLADDTNILFTEKDFTFLEGKIIKVIKQLENWFSTNNLTINMEKTKTVLFQARESSLIHRSATCKNN
jgi:hypothetical protein